MNTHRSSSRPRIVGAVAALAVLALGLGAARATTVAVDVDAAWSARSKSIGALLAYELLYHRSGFFHDGAAHRFVPRAFGLGTRLADVDRELRIELPKMVEDADEVELRVTIRERRQVDRLFREGRKWKWVPLPKWDRRKLRVDLRDAVGRVRLARARVRAEVGTFFARLEAFEEEHDVLGPPIRHACGWALDVSEGGIDATIHGLARARLIAAAVLQAWPTPVEAP